MTGSSSILAFCDKMAECSLLHLSRAVGLSVTLTPGMGWGTLHSIYRVLHSALTWGADGSGKLQTVMSPGCFAAAS